MKESERTAKAWHPVASLESLIEAWRGHWWRWNLCCSGRPKIKGVTERSWKPRMLLVEVTAQLQWRPEHDVLDGSIIAWLKISETVEYSWPNPRRLALCAVQGRAPVPLEKPRGWWVIRGYPAFYTVELWFCFVLIITIPWFCPHEVKKVCKFLLYRRSQLRDTQLSKWLWSFRETMDILEIFWIFLEKLWT